LSPEGWRDADASAHKKVLDAGVEVRGGSNRVGTRNRRHQHDAIAARSVVSKATI